MPQVNPNPKKSSSLVTDYNKKIALESAILHLLDIKAFAGVVLQQLTIQYSSRVPTAGVFFDKKTRNFQMLISPEWFIGLPKVVNRAAVLEHEVAHIIHRHVMVNAEANGMVHKKLNIAMDLVINQHINDLPEGCMLIQNFKDPKGNPFPAHKSFEHYYDLLTDDATMDQPDGKGGTTTTSVGDMLQDPTEAFDVHGWSDSDATEEDLLSASADLVRRAIDKANNSTYTVGGKCAKETLEDLGRKLRALNYKAILLNAFKKSLPSPTRKMSWKKPSRKYGFEAKGKLKSKVPRIEVCIDTSGSISVTEANEFLDIARGFLTNVGTATLNMFHEKNYYRKKMRKDLKIDLNEVQSGGTDLNNTFEVIAKSKCDLVIVLTDGYFGEVNVNTKKVPKVVTVLSKGGNTDHPLKKYGPTVEAVK